jgi:CRP/FNR family cyclic AMP-dependent transcriptional regulator
MSLGVILGLIGALLSIVAYTMKNMLSLRAVAIASNVCFLVYGIMEGQMPSILLNLVVIPLNFIRLNEIRQLVREVESATSDDPLTGWLLPQMTLRRVDAGQVLFRNGDAAKEMFYVHKGRVQIQELESDLGPGTLFGEIGIFAPNNRRTQTAICIENSDLYTLSQSDAIKLYYQNPKLGFHLMRLIVGRLTDDTARLRSAGGAVDAQELPGPPASSESGNSGHRASGMTQSGR